MTRAPIRLAVTLGDPRGIGPEVTAAALAALPSRAATMVVVGPEGTAVAPDVAVGRWHGGSSEAAGRLAGAAIEHAVALAVAGEVDGIVTAPIDKAALGLAGYPYPGHTEMLRALTGSEEVAMFMVAERTRLEGPLRVALATIHIPLALVPGTLSQPLLVSQTRLVAEALRHSWGIAAPRLALCALNPHASDGGRFGDEEARIMEPAIRELRAQGHDVTGPVPADTVFARATRGEFDAVVAPYHDVGMAAFKTVSFGAGVNVTLGLPFVRTSPDHGTALDLAGRGLADPASMMEAIRLATQLAARDATGALPAGML
jgi:4-hydroxythreonine-4-phosphate dehydrogenase